MPGRGKNRGDSCVVPIHFTWSGSLSGGAGSLQLSPSGITSNSTRLLNEADAWAHFRVRQLRFRLHRPATAINGTQAMGFVGGIQDTPPSTVATVTELLPSVVLAVSQTVPTEWKSPSAKELAGTFPWYKSINGAADASEEAPGALVIAGGTTDAIFAEVYAVFEFKTSVATANTPMEIRVLLDARARREAQAREQARRAVTRVLSGPPTAVELRAPSTGS